MDLRQHIGDVPVFQKHALLPFEPLLGHELSVEVSLESLPLRRIRAELWIHDPDQLVLWQSPAPFPMREDFLDQSTCFELFFRAEDEEIYHELDATPRRQWNLYTFNQYRSPNTSPPVHEPLARLSDLSIHKNHLSMTVDVSRILYKQARLKVGIAAVIMLQGEHPSYWALHHSCSEPDFHQQSDWSSELLLSAS